MKISVGVSVLAFLLYLPLIQVFTILGNSQSKVLLFEEAWARSQCRCLEQMVYVEQEYPGAVEHIYSPGCVPLLRCSGCCNDEKLACFPVSTSNISIQLLRITPAERRRDYVLLSFQEHQSCPENTSRGPSTKGDGRGNTGGGGEAGRSETETLLESASSSSSSSSSSSEAAYLDT